jgi:DNA-binding transcriptional regulator GbsR (MarR family)
LTEVIKITASDERNDMTLTPSVEKFISVWAEMACKWSVNRTVAEVHALFYFSAEPLSAEDISSALSVSRSNVSASLRELEGLGLIRPVHFRGDRKQYFDAQKNPWEAFRVIVDDHKRRVIDPAVDTFHNCLEEQERTAPEDVYTLERMRDVVSLFDAIIPLYDQLRRLPNGPVQNLFKVTATIKEILA